MVGIQIGSHINQVPLGDPSLFKVFEACERLGACVFVHPWDMAGEDRMHKYWLPWLVGMPADTSFAICSLMFSGVFTKLPKLRVCFAHGGGSFPGTFGRIEHGFNCRPDLVACDCPVPPREQLGRFYVDSLTHDPDALLAVLKLVGHDRVCLGSDYPFPLGEVMPWSPGGPGSMVEGMTSLSEEQKAKILWSNVLEFLGLQGRSDFFLGKNRAAIMRAATAPSGLASGSPPASAPQATPLSTGKVCRLPHDCLASAPLATPLCLAFCWRLLPGLNPACLTGRCGGPRPGPCAGYSRAAGGVT